MFKPLLLAAATAVALTSAAYAGPQFIDETGFAVSGYDVVAYRSLTQAPVGEAQPEGVPGRADITAEYNGATFAFASEANRDTFLENPAFYAPAYDGHCAYGVSRGGKVPGNPNLWRIVDDVLVPEHHAKRGGFLGRRHPRQHFHRRRQLARHRGRRRLDPHHSTVDVDSAGQ